MKASEMFLLFAYAFVDSVSVQFTHFVELVRLHWLYPSYLLAVGLCSTSVDDSLPPFDDLCLKGQLSYLFVTFLLPFWCLFWCLALGLHILDNTHDRQRR